MFSPHHYDARHITTNAICDLIPRTQYVHRDILVQPSTANTTPKSFAYTLDFPYSGKRLDTSKETCSICKSNPDISKLKSRKSCLKKSNFTSSVSLPSMEVVEKSRSDIEQVNRQWNKAYDNPDKVLDKISTDLDFLLNRSQDCATFKKVQEAPT